MFANTKQAAPALLATLSLSLGACEQKPPAATITPPTKSMAQDGPTPREEPEVTGPTYLQMLAAINAYRAAEQAAEAAKPNPGREFVLEVKTGVAEAKELAIKLSESGAPLDSVQQHMLELYCINRHQLSPVQFTQVVTPELLEKTFNSDQLLAIRSAWGSTLAATAEQK